MRHKLLKTCLFFTLPLWLVMRDFGASTAGSQILSAAKQATGGSQWDRIRTVHVQGTFEVGGLRGNYESWLDLRRSYSYLDERISHQDLGLIRLTTGWNGRVAWSADQTGDVCIADSERARRTAAFSTPLDRYVYLLRSGPSAEVRVKGDQTTESERFHVVQVTPRDALPFDVWLDTVTNRIKRIASLTDVERTTTLFSDFRPVGGVVFPFQMQESASDPGKFSELRTVSSIEINVDPPEQLFSPPPPVLSGVKFPAGRTSVTLDFRLIDNQIYLPVSINGQRQDSFVFDIGSTNTIDTARAQALGLKIVNAGATYGGGPEPMPAGLTKVKRLEIGDLKMEDQLVDTAPLSGIPGGPIDGAIGYELARRTVVIIDYASRQITFLKPETFRRRAQAIALPFRFASKSEVVVEASLDGIRGEFQLDTGQGSSLLINRPFAERTGLLRKYGSGGKDSVAGIGGVAQTVIFKPSRLVMGGLQPAVSEAEIVLSGAGSGAEEFIAGTIGNGILQQFQVTLDYGKRKIYLEKNATFGREAEPAESEVLETFDMGRPDPRKPDRGGWTGLTKMRRKKGEPVEVVEVDVDGPAAKAGISPGDLIVALNGVPIETLTSVAIARLLISPPGTEVRLSVRRGGTTRELSLKTQ